MIIKNVSITAANGGEYIKDGTYPAIIKTIESVIDRQGNIDDTKMKIKFLLECGKIAVDQQYATLLNKRIRQIAEATLRKVPDELDSDELIGKQCVVEIKNIKTTAGIIWSKVESVHPYETFTDRKLQEEMPKDNDCEDHEDHEGSVNEADMPVTVQDAKPVRKPIINPKVLQQHKQFLQSEKERFNQRENMRKNSENATRYPKGPKRALPTRSPILQEAEDAETEE